MSTDPTARHHAQILDWLSAALTDPTATSIYLFQDVDREGRWDVSITRDVDPAKEAAAQSQADRDLLYRMDGAYTPPVWAATMAWMAHLLIDHRPHRARTHVARLAVVPVGMAATVAVSVYALRVLTEGAPL